MMRKIFNPFLSFVPVRIIFSPFGQYKLLCALILQDSCYIRKRFILELVTALAKAKVFSKCECNFLKYKVSVSHFVSLLD
jgi:hypothetical protein